MVLKRAFPFLGFFLLAGLLFAQTAASKTGDLRFEVASIRSVGTIAAGQQSPEMGVKRDKGQFHAGYLTMRDLLSMAFEMRNYQIEGPDWIGTERFTISATLPPVPEGGKIGDAEIAAMMRPLLEERFALKLHTAKKDFPVYTLVQANAGILAKEAPLDAPERTVGVTGSGSAQGTFYNLGRGASLALANNRIDGKKLSMTNLAETLAYFVERPVVDQTGLSATYDILLELEPGDFQALMARGAAANGVVLPPQVMRLVEAANGSLLNPALAKMGLKLEPKKAPLDMVIVDSMNRTPTEN